MNTFEAYFATIIIETIVLLALLMKEDRKLVILSGIFASSVTFLAIQYVFTPAAAYLQPFWSVLDGITAYLIPAWWLVVLLFEVFAIAAEAFIYSKIFNAISWKEALRVSFCANTASFFAGLALSMFL